MLALHSIAGLSCGALDYISLHSVAVFLRPSISPTTVLSPLFYLLPTWTSLRPSESPTFPTRLPILCATHHNIIHPPPTQPYHFSALILFFPSSLAFPPALQYLFLASQLLRTPRHAPLQPPRLPARRPAARTHAPTRTIPIRDNDSYPPSRVASRHDTRILPRRPNRDNGRALGSMGVRELPDGGVWRA